MGTFDSIYQNKIRKLEEENRQLRKILREAEGGQYPPTPRIPTPNVSPPLAPERGYPGFSRDGKPTEWHPPFEYPDWAQEYGPWQLRPDGTEYPHNPITMPSLAPKFPIPRKPFYKMPPK